MTLSEEFKKGARWQVWRSKVFGAAWLLYAGYYFCRKNYPVAQPVIMAEFHWSNVDVGTIITAYLTAYALGQFLWGAAGDRYGARKVVAWGVALSMAANILFGFAASIPVMALLWGINGLAQATGWSATMKTMSAWFGLKERGRVMAWWSTCYQIGEVAATALASYLVSTELVARANAATGSQNNWQYSFWLPSLLLGLIGLVFFWGQRNHPEDLGLPSPDGGPKIPLKREYGGSWTVMGEVLRNKFIWILGCSYFCVKLVRYAFMFWLSTYLVKELGFKPDAAGYMSIVLPLAGFLGAVAGGYASDKLFESRRAPVSAIMMLGLALGVWLYSFLAASPILGPACLALIGFMTFGPDTLISATSAMDFGSKRAASSAAGFINGMGSIGAAIQGVLLGKLSDSFGWHAVFIFLVFLALAGAAMQFSMWNARGKN